MPSLYQLPQLRHKLIGREREISEIFELMGQESLVTLEGSGGIGKTSLAIELAIRNQERFPDGISFVKLEALPTDAEIADHLAAVCQVPVNLNGGVTQALIDHFLKRRALIVLDNCEHVLRSAARLIDSLLRSCSHLCFLATSRERLRVGSQGYTERTYVIPPLALPDPDSDWLSAPLDVPSIALFVQRTRSTGVEFDQADRAAMQSIGNIVGGLDGIPLAIELAAARARNKSLSEIAAEIGSHVYLTGFKGTRNAAQRHETVRRCIEWSVQLVSDNARKAFSAISVFADSWSTAAAVSVIADETIDRDAARSAIDELVDASLAWCISKRADASKRFKLLTPVRAVATEHLKKSIATQAASTRLARWLISLADRRFRINKESLAEASQHADDFRCCIEAAATANATLLLAQLCVAKLFLHRGSHDGLDPTSQLACDKLQNVLKTNQVENHGEFLADAPILLALMGRREWFTNAQEIYSSPSQDTDGQLAVLLITTDDLKDDAGSKKTTGKLEELAQHAKWAAAQLGKLKNAVDQVERLREVGGTPRLIAWNLANCAIGFFRLYDFATAERLFCEAKKVYPVGCAEDIGDAAVIAGNYINIFSERLPVDQAEITLNEQIERMKLDQNWGAAARACGTLSCLAREREDYGLCHTRLQEAIKFAVKGNEFSFAADCLRMIELLTVFKYQMSDQMAATILVQAFQIYFDHLQKDGLGKTLDRLNRRCAKSNIDLAIRAFIVAQRIRGEDVNLRDQFPNASEFERSVAIDSLREPWLDRAQEIVQQYWNWVCPNRPMPAPLFPAASTSRFKQPPSTSAVLDLGSDKGQRMPPADSTHSDFGGPSTNHDMPSDPTSPRATPTIKKMSEGETGHVSTRGPSESSTQSPNIGKGMSWQDARQKAEDHCKRNPYPGVKALARIIGCSPSTMSKAVRKSTNLKARRAESESRYKDASAGGCIRGATESIQQTREQAPDDDISARQVKCEQIEKDPLLRRLIRDASPGERKKYIEDVPIDKLKELAEIAYNDPDSRRGST